MKVYLMGLFLMSSNIQAEVIKLQAKYFIPTNNEQMLHINSFELKNYQVELSENAQPSMQFELPFEMTGKVQQKFKLVMTGKTDKETRILEGENAKAICSGVWTMMKCSIQFSKIEINKAQLKSELLKKFPESEAKDKFNLLLKFGNDPIGVAEVHL